MTEGTPETFELPTADILEIVAGGGNGSELIDLPRLLEDAAKELRALEAEVERLKEAITGSVADIAAERRRQFSEEGWSEDHDNYYTRGELSAAAACYAYFGWVRPSNGAAPTEWPWDAMWWKPSDRRRDLVKAGALIAAEIDRLDRAALANEG